MGLQIASGFPLARPSSPDLPVIFNRASISIATAIPRGAVDMSRTKRKLQRRTAAIETKSKRIRKSKRKPSADVIAPIPQQAMSIRQFAHAHDLSIDTYFQMQKDGIGPDVMRIGGRTLISVESAARWRSAREAATREESRKRKERHEAAAEAAVIPAE
jgi:hypothetical protein